MRNPHAGEDFFGARCYNSNKLGGDYGIEELSSLGSLETVHNTKFPKLPKLSAPLLPLPQW